MRISLRRRIERLEDRIISESEDKLLPLAVIRHCLDGSVSSMELKRWSSVIDQITAAADLAEEELAREIARTQDTSEMLEDKE